MTDDPKPKKSKTPLIVGIVLAVGCIPVAGCVAAIAIPAFTKYIKTSKSIEAQANMTALLTSVRSYCEMNNGYIPAGPLPATPKEGTQSVSFATDPGFAALGFDPGASVRYSYSVELNPDGSATAKAEGDLDGDGRLSLFEARCDKECICTSISSQEELE